MTRACATAGRGRREDERTPDRMSSRLSHIARPEEPGVEVPGTGYNRTGGGADVPNVLVMDFCEDPTSQNQRTEPPPVRCRTS
jgi:hypothetical protein